MNKFGTNSTSIRIQSLSLSKWNVLIKHPNIIAQSHRFFACMNYESESDHVVSL